MGKFRKFTKGGDGGICVKYKSKREEILSYFYIICHILIINTNKRRRRYEEL